MIYSIDTEGRLIDVNPFWLKRMGYERDEVIGKKSFESLTEESRKRAVEDTLPNFHETGEYHNVPYQFITKTGDLLDVLLSATSIKGKDGKVFCSLATLVDITDLRASQLAQLDLLESVDDRPVAIDVFDVNDKLARWNQAYRSSYKAIEGKIVLGASFADLHQATIDAGIFKGDSFEHDELKTRLASQYWSIERPLRPYVPGLS